jgi:hypothetical protein
LLGDDLDAADSWVDGWQASLQERADQARLLRERLEAVTGTGWDRKRLVQVTVATSGVLADVVLDDRTREQAVATTRSQILEAGQAAQADLARKAARVTAETIGMKHPTADAVVRSYLQRMSPPRGDDAGR